MPGRDAGLGVWGILSLSALAAVVFLPGLGSSSRLTYHEAFVAQGAREMIATGDWQAPRIGGRPWLEKPPLPFWLAGLSMRVFTFELADGGPILSQEAAARLPSVLASLALILGVGLLASRWLGPGPGRLAGAFQATTVWTLLRGRLAEADIILAALICWTFVAFDRLRVCNRADDSLPLRSSAILRTWRLGFFALLGALSLVKGIGFGAVLVVATLAVLLIWERDAATGRRLSPWGFRRGWLLAAAIALAWPISALARFGMPVLGLWLTHVTDRFASQPEQFIGEPWWQYVPAVLAQGMPWTPLAFWGAWISLRRAISRKGTQRSDDNTLDRLLWAWAVVPLLLVSAASARNAHYAIHAQIPWSIWAVFGLARLGDRLAVRARRRWGIQARLASAAWLRRRAFAGLAALGAVCGLGIGWFGPWFDRRGVEWAFYEAAGDQLEPGEPLALLYDDWDRNPYETPFGPIPHDLAVRLFYLNHPASWHFHPDDLAEQAGDRAAAIAVIGRSRDVPALERLGRVEVVAEGPAVRPDRSYLLVRVSPVSTSVSSASASSSGSLTR
jgi:4-amino-4-deoxy-L-arabinose transferase-like glycosyltransferase